MKVRLVSRLVFGILMAISISMTFGIGCSDKMDRNIIASSGSPDIDTVFVVDTLECIPDSIFIVDTLITTDTVYNEIFDTLEVYDTTVVIDTVYEMEYVVDTLYEEIYIYDTTIIVDTLYEEKLVYDTIVVIDTLYEEVFTVDTLYEEIYIYDTIVVVETDTLYLTEYIVDTLTEYIEIHDTVVVIETDTTWLYEGWVIMCCNDTGKTCCSCRNKPPKAVPECKIHHWENRGWHVVQSTDEYCMRRWGCCKN